MSVQVILTEKPVGKALNFRWKSGGSENLANWALWSLSSLCFNFLDDEVANFGETFVEHSVRFVEHDKIAARKMLLKPFR